MTLPPLADVTMLADLIGGIAEADVARAEAMLAAASSKIRNYTGRDWCNAEGDAIDWGTLPLRYRDDIERITVAAAFRAFTNPTQASQMGAGPFNITYANSSPDVYLTASEQQDLNRILEAIGARGRTGLTTISTTREDPIGSNDFGTLCQDGTYYAEVSPDGQPIPWLNEGGLRP